MENPSVELRDKVLHYHESGRASEVNPSVGQWNMTDLISMFSKTKNQGLVFVSMGSHGEALASLTNLQSYEFMGTTLYIMWAKPKKSPSASAQPKPVHVHNLFVANLPFKARPKDLMESFSAENPNVVSAEIIFNEKPRGSAGYGFVSFNTKQEAEVALTAFQGKMFMGRAIRVSSSKKFFDNQQKRYLNQQMNQANQKLKENKYKQLKLKLNHLTH